MAAATLKCRLLNGYTTKVGNKKMAVVSFVGPASYPNPGGTAISGKAIGFSNIEFVEGTSTISGTYDIRSQPTGQNGGPTYLLRWFTQASVEVANAVNLSAETGMALIVGG